MDLSKTRCAVCLKRFCCTAHKNDHQLKIHPETFKLNKDILLKAFEKKAEHIMLQTKHYRENQNNGIKTQLNEMDSNSFQTEYDSIDVHFRKRITPGTSLHKGGEKYRYSTAMKITSVSQTRRPVLIPVRRLQANKGFNYVKENIPSNGEMEVLSKSSENVKTSTPVVGTILEKNTPQVMWQNISPASTISDYFTPTNDSIETKSEQLKKSSENKCNKGSNIVPLRGIMSKVSRYSFDQSYLNPSPNTSVSRCRKVTFSFEGSQVSTNGSSIGSIKEGFESVNPEKENNENYNREYSHVVEVNVQVDENGQTAEYTETVKHSAEDSSIIVEKGLFSCMTNIFCSAIHTIPSLSSWRKSKNVYLNRSKRARSPDNEEDALIGVQSPDHKRHCYPCDLRHNPIRARKPLSNISRS